MHVMEISATSRVSFKQITRSGDVFYTFDYTEKWGIDPQDDLPKLKEELWKTVNDEVTRQVIETKNLYKQ